MKDHLNLPCYWHTFMTGLDPFGGQTFDRPWMRPGDIFKWLAET